MCVYWGGGLIQIKYSFVFFLQNFPHYTMWCWISLGSVVWCFKHSNLIIKQKLILQLKGSQQQYNNLFHQSCGTVIWGVFIYKFFHGHFIIQWFLGNALWLQKRDSEHLCGSRGSLNHVFLTLLFCKYPFTPSSHSPLFGGLWMGSHLVPLDY